jgi:mRNA-degrading endonuclease RelE of RelBE toxin-antitoxin system
MRQTLCIGSSSDSPSAVGAVPLQRRRPLARVQSRRGIADRLLPQSCLPRLSVHSRGGAVREELSDLSKARNVKKLVNYDHGYRLRVGDFRVFFEFDGAIRVVTIEEVRKRDEQTY